MSEQPPLNMEQMRIGSYVMQFVDNELLIALTNEPGQIIVRLEEEDALRMVEWLGVTCPRFFQAVMRNGLEALREQIRAEFHSPEPEEPEPRVVYIPPGSVNETMVAMVRAADVTPICNQCLQRLCPACYNCHNQHCPSFYPCDYPPKKG
jgi:hypothetical protein